MSDRVEKRKAWVKAGPKGVDRMYISLPVRLGRAFRTYCEFKQVTKRELISNLLYDHLTDDQWLTMTAITEDIENYTKEVSDEEGQDKGRWR